ncbi:hypothetical protein IFT48_03065 [Pseudomonas fluorescens]|uniref:hypothetical protein n=1 Tax=Pseudomonas fluorescens TaxID=294 RepID=UPI001930DB28|nr:hypothetical protein [Pseudomonas fluorescens]MBD8088948.1 hypothetical protein [Pseudomonas fluorescens]
MTSLRLLDADLYLKDETSDFCWDLSYEHICHVQDAFVSYMEEGLSFDDILEHVESEDEDFEFESVPRMDAARAFCAVAMCVPHPRIQDLVGYIADVGGNHRDEIQSVLDTLFEYNMGRKMMVAQTLDSIGLEHLMQFSPLTADDAKMLVLINDPKLSKRLDPYLKPEVRQEGILGVTYRPARTIGWVDNNPEIIPHTEVLMRLKRLGNTLSTWSYGEAASTCDAGSWLENSDIDVKEQWTLEGIESTEIDLSVLDMPQTKRTMALFTSECVAAIVGELKSNDPIHRTILGKLTQTFLDAGVDAHKLFYMTCRGMSAIEYTDFQERGGVDRGDYIREALNYTQAQWPIQLRQMAEHMVAQEPVESLLSHCFSDRLLNAAYAVIPDKRLLTQMGSTGRDKAMASDLGL